MTKAGPEKKAWILFAVTVFVIAIGTMAWFLLSSHQYATYQILTREAVSGLNRDAPVEFHGVMVGKVTDVELVNASLVRIILEIKKEAPVSAATTATIMSRGLSPKGFTGYVYIALEDTGNDTSKLVTAPGEKFPAIPVTRARDISLDTAISQANELIQTLLDQTTVASLKQSLEGLNEISKTLVQNNERLNSLISNSERASRELGPLLKSSNESISALQTQILPQAYKALSDLESLTSSLNGFATEIGRDPSALLRGKGRPESAPGEGR